MKKKPLNEESRAAMQNHHGLISGQSLIAQALRANQAIQSVVKELGQVQTSEKIPVKLQRAAWRHVYDALWNSVWAMNRHAMKTPEQFGFAAEACYWPVVKSPGLSFMVGEPGEREIFNKLKVGTATVFKVGGSRWRPNDDIGRWAVELWHRVYNRRYFECSPDSDDPAEEWNKANSFRKWAEALPPFSQDGAWKKWFELAKEIFEQDFEHQWSDPRTRRKLTSLVPLSKKGSPGRVKAAILERIKERFASMADENKT